MDRAHVATNYDNLKTALQAEANLLEDDIAKYEALVLIDQYIAALTEQATATATGIASYAVADRQVTRSTQGNVTATVAKLRAQLDALLYGCASLMDCRKLTETNTE